MGLGKDVPYEKWSRSDYRTAYEEAEGLRKKLFEERDEERKIRQQLDEALKTARKDMADLKARLQAAETANQYMRGYLARVQEDDTVREELLTVGEPGGEQRMVPKRKPTPFPRPSDFNEPDRGGGYGTFMDAEERHRKARHWITY